MARKARTKNKKITLIDVKEPNNLWKDRNSWWERYMNKALRNSLVGPFNFMGECEQNPPQSIITIDGFCSTCGAMLFKPFPDGFPDEWKMCCCCCEIAGFIAHNLQPNLKYPFKEAIRKKITLCNTKKSGKIGRYN